MQLQISNAAHGDFREGSGNMAEEEDEVDDGGRWKMCHSIYPLYSWLLKSRRYTSRSGPHSGVGDFICFILAATA